MVWEGTRRSVGVRPCCARTFVDDGLQAAFERDGFVVVPMLSPEAVARLRPQILRLCDGASGFVEPMDLAGGERAQVSELVLRELADAASAPFVDHDFFVGTQFVKKPGEGSEKHLHMDWAVVDESRFVGGVVWIALDDSTAANGGLRAVPGTNRLDAPHRGSPDVHFPVGGTELGAELERRSVDVDVPAGHAAIFDHRLLHSSHQNRTSEARVAVGLGFKPRAADLQHYRVDEDGVTHRYVIDPGFLLAFDPSADLPAQHIRSHEVLDDRQWDLEVADLDVLAGPVRPLVGAEGA